MNYTQIVEELEQLKKGRKIKNIERLIKTYQQFFQREWTINVIYIPSSYEDDSIGIYCGEILKQHKYIIGRFTTYSTGKLCKHIFLNQKAISQNSFAHYVEKVFKAMGNQYREYTQLEIFFFASLLFFDEKKCDYIVLPKDIEESEIVLTDNVLIEKRSLLMQQFSIDTYEKLEIQGASKNEIYNCFKAITLLKNQGFNLNEKYVKKALFGVKCEGRFELLKAKPYYIIDGADNRSSVKQLMSNLQYYFPENPYIFVMGVLQGEYEEFMKECVYMAQQVITVTPQREDALSALELVEKIKKLNHNITNSASMEEAVEIANLLADKNTVVVAFGHCSWLEQYKKVVAILK